MDDKLTAADWRELDRILTQRMMGLPNAHTGPFEKTRRCAKHQNMCADCGEYAAQISWKDDVHDSSTWFFATCDVCDHEFCADCISNNDDGNGMTCHTCYGSGITTFRSR